MGYEGAVRGARCEISESLLLAHRRYGRGRSTASKAIKRDVDELFSILPFEVEFFEGKHHFPIHYVGNPTAQEVREFLRGERRDFRGERREERLRVGEQSSGMRGERNVIALLAGSRQQEIKDNLPAMIEATRDLAGQYDVVLAGAPLL